MKLSFLIQLLLLIILIVGVYLIFNNGVSGRNKLILIIFLVVIGIYLFNKLPFLRGYNEVIENPVSAEEQYEFTSDTLKQSNGEFAISSWIYINDWNKKYGQEKVILRKGESGEELITMKLGEYENNLHITLNVFSETKSDFQDSLLASATNNGFVEYVDTDGGSEVTKSQLECKSEGIYHNPVDQGETGNTNDGYLIHGGTFNTSSDAANIISCGNSGPVDIVIENINLQKWVNIIVAVNDRTLDVYLNGKLVTSKAFDNIIDTGMINGTDLVVTPDNGFGGFVSKIQYYPNFITPKKAWEIYRSGFGDAFASALDKYNLSVTFYEDQIEKKKYWVF